MNKKIKIIICLITIFSLTLLSEPYAKEHREGHEGHSMAEEESSSTEEIIYQCPMHPEVTSLKEGETCPKCGMNLVASERASKNEKQEMQMNEHDMHDMNDMPNMPNMNDMKKESKVKKEKKVQKKTEEAKIIYQCPMHPEVTSTKEGERCPKCGMHLVKVETSSMSEASMKTMPKGHGHVKFEYYKEQRIGIKTVKVKKEKIFKSLESPGRVAFDPELYTAQSEYIEALKQWDRIKESPLKEVKKSTKEMINSAKIRLQVMGLSDGEIKKLARKKHLTESLLIARGGGDNLIYADFYEMDLPFIEKGLSAEIRANFLMGEVLAAQVISVDELIDPKTRTAKVRLKLKKGGPKIRPQSYVNVRIFSNAGTHIALPTDAVLDTGKETFVFVKKGEGHFEPRLVTVMFEADGKSAIASGVEVGEEIVVNGNFMLDSESRLKAVISDSAGAPASQGHKH